MKKLCKLAGVLAAAASLFVLGCSNDDDGDTFYATTKIDEVDVTATAYPGVNVLTWKAVKDAASYDIYKTTGDGKIEETLESTSTYTYLADTAIEANTSYKYRIVANPKDNTVHDASQKEVSLKTAAVSTNSDTKGKWAPDTTAFLDLAKYESNYNENDAVLSSSTITATLAGRSGSKVRVSFPSKPYASYTVTLAQKGGSALYNSNSRDTQATVYGYNFNGTATVDLTALYTGTKEVTVKAVPLNTAYNSSTVVSSSTVEVTDYSEIAYAVANNKVNAEWTNYNSSTKVATARIYFTPYTFNGSEFSTSEYTVYRAVYGSDGETITVDSEATSKRVYSSIVSLGNPNKDTSVDENDETVYYVDDSFSISADSDVSAVRYYVVLNHDDKYKSNSVKLTVPTDSDGNWNFTPDSSYTTENNVSIRDIYIDEDGYINVSARNSSYSTVSFTYGSFDTLNEAKTAVESELPTSISFDDDTSSTYSLSGKSTGTVTTGKYYAFRLLATKTSADDEVVKVIAVPRNDGNYYLEVQSGYSSNISNYGTVGTPSVSRTKEVGTTNYSSVTLTFSASNARYFNIYRAISDYSSSDYATFSLLATVENSGYPYSYSETYTDSSTTLKATTLDEYVYYKVEAVGNYSTSESSTVSVSGLQAPVISLSESKISWSSVNNATIYYIYRATSQSALEALSNYNYETSTTSLYYSATASYASDYYYAVRAYSSSDYEYSELSNVVTLEKAAAPEVTDFDADLYSSDSDTYTYSLSWTALSSYSGYYYILRYTTDTETDASTVKSYFENSTSYSNSYQNDSTDSTSDNVTTSSYYSHNYYAVATRVYDSVTENYVWTSSDVKDLSSFDSTLTYAYNSGTFTLEWTAIDGAASYAVYNVNQSSSTLYVSNIDTTTPAKTTAELTATVTPSTSYTYKFFIVVGLDENSEVVGYSNVVRSTH